MQYKTVQYNTIQYYTIQYNTIQYYTIQYTQYNKIKNKMKRINVETEQIMQINKVVDRRGRL